jgi:hypothetical protein
MGPNGPNVGPIGPNSPLVCQGWAQDGPKIYPDGPKLVPTYFQMTPNWPDVLGVVSSTAGSHLNATMHSRPFLLPRASCWLTLFVGDTRLIWAFCKRANLSTSMLAMSLRFHEPSDASPCRVYCPNSHWYRCGLIWLVGARWSRIPHPILTYIRRGACLSSRVACPDIAISSFRYGWMISFCGCRCLG